MVAFNPGFITQQELRRSLGLEKLTGMDYLTKPVTELQSHPDFSPHAMRVVIAVTEMTTDKLENLDLLGDPK